MGGFFRGAASGIGGTLLVSTIAMISVPLSVASAETVVSEPFAVGTPHACEWSSHDQRGSCVGVDTGPIRHRYFDIGVSKSVACPPDYPYPYLGAFSANPIWHDSTVGGWAVSKAVSVTGRKVDHLSYQGTYSRYDVPERGWITLAGTPTGKNANFQMQGSFECSTDFPRQW